MRMTIYKTIMTVCEGQGKYAEQDLPKVWSSAKLTAKYYFSCQDLEAEEHHDRDHWEKACWT